MSNRLIKKYPFDPSGAAGFTKRVAAKGAAVAAKRAAPYVQRGFNIARQELMRSETAMRKQWDNAGPAARRYLNKGLKDIRNQINKTY